ncbi:MAG: CoA transferase [Actinomycetota bacterium]
MSTSGPLSGLRVLDLTDDLGRFGTKLLAEYGATVWRPPRRGTPGNALTGAAGDFGGVLDWWFDAAKQRVRIGLDDAEGIEAYRRLAAEADLIVESAPPGLLADLGVDHADLVASNPTLAQVSVTPFGRTGPRAEWRSSDLVAGALGGALSLTGTPEEPLNPWGGQSHNYGGFLAAISGLAAVSAARRDGRGQLVDLSLHEALTGNIENLLMQYVYDDELPYPKVAGRQGSLHWLGIYQVMPAGSGNVMVTPTPDTEALLTWLVDNGITEAEPLVGADTEELLGRVPELMGAIERFVSTRPAGELFTEAQSRHVAFGEVQTVAQVADNPQFAHRGFFSDIDVGGGEHLRGPWRLVRFSDTPIPTPSAPTTTAVDVDEALAQAGPRPRPAPTPQAAAGSPGVDRLPKPLDGLTVLDLSWVLAGPSATRILGDLGADVIKLQTEERATLVNRPDYPYYPVWNRSKRAITLDLKHPGALDVARRLIEQADVLIENYSAGVLDRLGLGWEQIRAWNDRLVYISMSGCGHDGPWSDVISYAPTIHALCGLTHLTNPSGRGDIGCGFSLNDHAAGFGATFSVLAALEARERTGRGQHIDMAQLEVGAFLVGPALVEHFATGHEAVADGNVDALGDAVPNEVYRCADGGFVAVTAADDAMWARLASAVGLADDAALATVAGRRAERARVDATLGAWAAERTAEAAMVELQACGVAAGAVQDAADLIERDPQLADRGFWLTAHSDAFGPRLHERFPALWSDADLAPYRPAPAYLGEANFEVYAEHCGLDPEAVAEGMADGLFQ